MAKDTVYVAPTPDAQGRFSYSAEDDAVWGTLFDRQMATLPGRILPDFLTGVAALGLTGRKVPQVVEIDRRLAKLSGAGVEGVPAIIPPRRFFTLLSERRFPVATFLRRREDMDYIEEPDLFHEVFGHCPLLTDPAYARMIGTAGRVALDLPKGMSWHFFRLFWFTVEFGMIRTAEGLRAYGAGLASSPAELENAFSGTARMRDFDLMEVLRTPYRIDIVQPVYFVIDGFDSLARALSDDLPQRIARAQALGDLPPAFVSA